MGAVVVVAAALTACADASTTGRDGASQPASETTVTPNDTANSGAGGTAATDGRVDDDGPLGSAGAALLSASPRAAVIEVDRSANADLRVDARAVVAEELQEHGAKQSVTAAGDSTVPGQRTYSSGDLRAITEASRAAHSTADTAAIYILVLEGRYERENVTGVAFQATSFAVFPNQLDGGPLGVQREAFERALLTHELGHLFGLVNLTGEGRFHEDPEHPGHSTSQESVMYWAVEDISVRNLFRGGPPTEYDAADREEMSRIRAT